MRPSLSCAPGPRSARPHWLSGLVSLHSDFTLTCEWGFDFSFLRLLHDLNSRKLILIRWLSAYGILTLDFYKEIWYWVCSSQILCVYLKHAFSLTSPSWLPLTHRVRSEHTPLIVLCSSAFWSCVAYLASIQTLSANKASVLFSCFPSTARLHLASSVEQSLTSRGSQMPGYQSQFSHCQLSGLRQVPWPSLSFQVFIKWKTTLHRDHCED